MNIFLKGIHAALDNDRNSEVIAFYTDISKAFDKVPHFEPLKKVANIGLGGCLLQIFMDYLNNRKQFVRIDNTSSGVRDVTSGVIQGSLLGSLLFCIFIHDFSEVLRPIHLRRRKKSLDIPGRPRQHCNVGQIKQDGTGTGQMC